MDVPKWEQGEAKEEADYQQLLREQGAREEAQRRFNRTTGDYIGLEDGRPGISFDLLTGRTYMPPIWRVYIWLGLLALLAILAFGTRMCVGEEKAQQILQDGRQDQPASL